MEALREWAAALCAAAVLCAASGMTAPEEKNGRGIKTIFAAVILCTVVLPLTNLNVCGIISLPDAEKYTPDSRLCSAFEQQTASAVSSAVRELAADCLAPFGVEAEDISVTADISSDGCISIGRIAVAAEAGSGISAREITDALYGRLGLDAEVIMTEEDKWDSAQ